MAHKIVAVKLTDDSDWTIILETDDNEEAKEAFTKATTSKLYRDVCWTDSDKFEQMIAEEKSGINTIYRGSA